MKKHTYSVTVVGEWINPCIGTQKLKGTGLLGQERLVKIPK